MKIGKSLDKTGLFNKTEDTSDDINEGAAQLFYPDADKTKVSYLPAGAISYLDIKEVTENPGTGEEGEIIYNTTDSKHYMWETDAWVEVLFTMEKITP